MKIKSFISLALLCAIAGGVTPAQAQSPSKEQTIGFIAETMNKCDFYSVEISSNEVMTLAFGRDYGSVKFALKHIGSTNFDSFRSKVFLTCRGEEGSCMRSFKDGKRYRVDETDFSQCPDATDIKLKKAFDHLIKFYDAKNKSLF